MADDSATSAEETSSGESREQGVDIGDLSEKLDDHSYPTTNSEIVEEYGDHVIEMPKGDQTVEEVLGGLEGESQDQEYEDKEEVRQMIYNMVGSEAIGREGYSDRGGVAGDEDATSDDDSGVASEENTGEPEEGGKDAPDGEEEDSF